MTRNKLSAKEMSSEVPEEGLEDFQEGFLKDRLSQIPVLESALQKSDFQSIQKIAHNWKGFSAPYGFHHLGVLGGRLETEAKTQNLENCQNLIIEIKYYLDFKGNLIHK